MSQACPALLKKPHRWLLPAIAPPYCTVTALNIILLMGIEGSHVDCLGADRSHAEPFAVSHTHNTLMQTVPVSLDQLLWLCEQYVTDCRLPETSQSNVARHGNASASSTQEHPQAEGTIEAACGVPACACSQGLARACLTDSAALAAWAL